MPNPNPTPPDREASSRGGKRSQEVQRINRELRQIDAENQLANHLDAAIGALGEVVRDADAAVRVQAAEKILTRLLGRPAQVVAGDQDRPVRIVVESIARSKHVRDE